MTAAVLLRPDRTRLRLINRKSVGGFFLFTAGIHVGIVAADTESYRRFADDALFGAIREVWHAVFMAHPTFWGLALAAGELALGLLLLAGGRWARVGWVGVIAFHLALLLFGWWAWAWCLPALVLVTAAATAEAGR
jgi:hypothetical protein